MPLPAVLTLVADKAYIPHVKSVMVNAVREGEWKGDFCLILPPDIDAQYFRSRGIFVLTDDQPRHFRKFALFDQYFNQQFENERGGIEHRWRAVLYLDADVLIQNPLEPLLHEVEWGTILADRDPFDLHHAFTYWARKPDYVASPEAPALLERLWGEYDPNWLQYCTAVMVYNPRTLAVDARGQLRAMREKIEPINTHVYKGTDQPVINLTFYDRWKQIRSDLFCYWESAWEETIVIHYCSGYSAWIKKNPDQHAYFNEKLGRPCHDIYLECLEAFEETFPVKP